MHPAHRLLAARITCGSDAAAGSTGHAVTEVHGPANDATDYMPNTSLYDTYTVSSTTGTSTSQPSPNGIDAMIAATM